MTSELTYLGSEASILKAQTGMSAIVPDKLESIRQYKIKNKTTQEEQIKFVKKL